MEEIEELRGGTGGASRVRDTGNDTTEKLEDVIGIIKQGCVTIATLADTKQTRRELEEAIALLQTRGLDGCGTPGWCDHISGEMHTGVLIVWDPTHIRVENRDTEGRAVATEVEEGRIVSVEVEEVASCRKWTQFGVYMPVRQRTATVVRPTWEKLTEALDATRGEYMIGGDFNAETEEALRERGAQRATLADRLFQQMLGDGGRELLTMADEATYRAGTQIDNWVVTSGLASCMGRTSTMPGVCGDDHRAVAVEFFGGVGGVGGPREFRERGVSTFMDREVEERFTNTVQEVFDDEVEADAEKELSASERLERLTRVLTRHARAVVATGRAKDDDKVGGEERPAGGGEASGGAVSYTHLTLPTTPYV